MAFLEWLWGNENKIGLTVNNEHVAYVIDYKKPKKPSFAIDDLIYIVLNDGKIGGRIVDFHSDPVLGVVYDISLFDLKITSQADLELSSTSVKGDSIVIRAPLWSRIPEFMIYKKED